MPSERSSAILHGVARAGARLFPGRYGRVPSSLAQPQPDTVSTEDGPLALLRWPAQGPDSGPPLVLLHGLNQNAWVWARCATALPRDRDIIALTLPGHGLSAPPGAGHALTHTTHSLLQAIDALGLQRFHLAGHSWGGKIATLMTALAADRVQSAILADPVPPAGLGPMVGRFSGLIDLAFAPERQRFPDRDSHAAGAHHVSHLAVTGTMDEADQRLWQGNYRQQADGQLVHRLSEEGFRDIVDNALSVDIRPHLTDLRAPLLLLRPTLSVAHWPGSLRPLKRLPGFQHRRVWGDHSFIHTNPYDTAQAIADFIARV